MARRYGTVIWRKSLGRTIPSAEGRGNPPCRLSRLFTKKATPTLEQQLADLATCGVRLLQAASLMFSSPIGRGKSSGNGRTFSLRSRSVTSLPKTLGTSIPSASRTTGTTGALRSASERSQVETCRWKRSRTMSMSTMVGPRSGSGWMVSTCAMSRRSTMIGWILRYFPGSLSYWLIATPAGGSPTSTRVVRTA